MLAAPIPANDAQRLSALRNAVCSYAPREERFDRLTRTVRRLLQVPIALISIVEEDEQWFRSVQGLEIAHTPRDISFCGHVVATGRPLVIHDTWQDSHFLDNPLVTGPPGIRSYVGWPLEIAPGIIAGTLCAIDTMPREFSRDELAGLRDLARMAETELRAHAAASLQKTLLMRLDLMQRRNALDPVTGCWTIRGFRELLGLAVDHARAEGTQLALCLLQVQGAQDVAGQLGGASPASVWSVLAQLLRERLPGDGALARLGEADFCALVPAATPQLLNQLLAPVALIVLEGVLPDGRQVHAGLDTTVVRLADLGPDAETSHFWAAILTASAAGAP